MPYINKNIKETRMQKSKNSLGYQKLLNQNSVCLSSKWIKQTISIHIFY